MADAAATVASQAPLLWLGAVAVGAIVPLAAAFLGRRTGNWKLWAPAAIIAALVGAVCMRVVFYNLGPLGLHVLLARPPIAPAGGAADQASPSAGARGGEPPPPLLAVRGNAECFT